MISSEQKEDGEYFYNIYRAKRFGDNVLVATDHGQWAILHDKEFRKMRTNNITPQVKNILHDKGIIVDQDNIEEIIQYYKNKSKYIYKGTSLHIMVMTKTCNNICSYCHASAIANKKLNMTNETAKKVVDFI